MTLSPNLYIGLGSVVYALVKADNQLHNLGSLKARMTLIESPHGELAMQSFIVREHDNIAPDDAYRFALCCFTSDKKAFTKQVKKQFMALIQKVAQADQHVSSEEMKFIKRFRFDIQGI